MPIPRIPGERPRDLSQHLTEVRVRIDARQAGQRLDLALGFFLRWRSRTSIRKLIEEGFVHLDGRAPSPSRRVRQGETIVVQVPDPPSSDVDPAKLDLDVPLVYADDEMLAFDKPAGLAVHPVGRRLHGTLIHWLHGAYRCPEDPSKDVIPKLVHRIDVETSGVLLVGLNDWVHSELAKQFEDRTVTKVYQAVVHGSPPHDEGRVDLPIGPAVGSAVRLKLEARNDERGMPAATRYRVLRRSGPYTLVELYPETGRTHQLRVHMEAIGCPLVGDKLYGGNDDIFLENLAGELSETSRARLVLDRHALHAARLTFFHPRKEEEMTLEAPLPEAFEELLDS